MRKYQTLHRYSCVQEYIDLEIDNFRNNLIRVRYLCLQLLLKHVAGICCMCCLQTRMILNIGNVVFASVFAVASIWGMNLADDHVDSTTLFDVVSVILMLMATSRHWAQHKNL